MEYFILNKKQKILSLGFKFTQEYRHELNYHPKYNILTTFKDNINVTLCVEPSLVTTKDNIDHFIKSLDSILKNNIYTLVLNLIKNKIMNNYLFLK